MGISNVLLVGSYGLLGRVGGFKTGYWFGECRDVLDVVYGW